LEIAAIEAADGLPALRRLAIDGWIQRHLQRAIASWALGRGLEVTGEPFPEPAAYDGGMRRERDTAAPGGTPSKGDLTGRQLEATKLIERGSLSRTP
jgi:hypothetical protein